MSELLKNIDARTRLAGTNKLEILLFTLGEDARTGRGRRSESTCSRCVR
jgi:two-component system, chemotaxis family, chemotaxis protein CheV